MTNEDIIKHIIIPEKIKAYYAAKDSYNNVYKCYLDSIDNKYILDIYQSFDILSEKLNPKKVKNIINTQPISEYTYAYIVYCVISEFIKFKYKYKLSIYFGTDMINYNNKDYRYYLYFNLSNLECGKLKISDMRTLIEEHFHLIQVNSIYRNNETRICFVPKDNNWEQLYTLYRLSDLIL